MASGARGVPVLRAVLLALATVPAAAGPVKMRDYALLRSGMSEAEVIYRLGPCDHEVVYQDPRNYLLRKVCYYLPGPRPSGGWITEVRYDHGGQVTALARYRGRP